MEFLIVAGVFAFVLLLTGELYFIFQGISRPEVREARKRLRTIAALINRTEDVEIIKNKSLSAVPWLNRLLLRLPWAGRMETLMETADSPYPFGFYVLSSILMFMSCQLILTLYAFGGANPFDLVISLFAGLVPFWCLHRRKVKRLARLSAELPDALEMMARAMKAGHAFTGGLKMVAEEFDGPVGVEFGKTLNEINFGIGAAEALKNLAARVKLPDVNFFVISVLIQRETGGNLTEVLEKLSYIIRERFKFYGKVKALSAEGKLSAAVLVAIPFFVAGALVFIQPDYIKTLLEDPIGHLLIGFSIVTIISGIIMIRKMVDLKV